MPDTIFDLHVHTTFGSLDSALTPERLMREAPHIGLHGAAVTEHRRAWSHDLLQRMRDDGGAFVSVSREVESDMGHLLVVGVDHHVRYHGHDGTVRAAVERLNDEREADQLVSADELHRIVRDEGGLLVAAHPFRYFRTTRNLLYGDHPRAATLSPVQLADHPVFALVDEIEALNGDCTEDENRLALAVAHTLGMRGTGGSDAHREVELARCATVFQRPITSVEELVAELRRGQFTLARRIWQPSVMVNSYRSWPGEP